MKAIFINQENKIRNGWWIFIFVFFIFATRFIYGPITRGLKDIGIMPEIVGATAAILVFLVTWLCLRLRKETLESGGLKFDVRWFKEFIVGILIGGLWLAAVILPVWIIGGVSFELNPERSVSVIALGFYTFAFAALLEELLHKGFIFQRIIDGLGFWWAQGVMAVIFAAGHLGNPDMDGATAVRAFLDLAMASIIFGLAYWKTKSLALPVGLHLGWNWIQGNVFGINVSGYEKSGWLQANYYDLPEWISGGKFGIEGSIFSLIVSMGLLFIFLKWSPKREQNCEPEPSVNDTRVGTI